MPDMAYRIRVKKDDLEVEVEGDKQWVEDKFKEITAKESYAPLPEKVEAEGVPKTLVELLEAKGNPQKHTQLVALYAFWLLKVEKMGAFNIRDIISCYNNTRRKKPQNVNQIINSNVRYNIFAQASEKKEGLKSWFLTDTGEKVVDSMK